MIGLKINNVFLDLFPNTQLRLDLRTFSYLTSGDGQIKGGFAYTINVPRSSKNMRALNEPDRVDAYMPLLQDEPIELHFTGIPIFMGKAYVRKGGGNIGLYIIFNELNSLKNIRLNELDLGGDRVFGGTAEALNKAQNPLANDFSFFDIKNEEYFAGADNDPGTIYSKFQNHFDGTNFTNANDHLNSMPFIRLEYLIDKIFNLLGYELSNEFQINNELRSIFLYNPVSFYNESGNWPATVNLTNHLPKTKVTDFIKQLLINFNLGIYLNPFTRTTSLTPLEDIVSADVSEDWTNKLIGTPTFQTNAVIPGRIVYGIDDKDKMMTDALYRQVYSTLPYTDEGEWEHFPIAADDPLGFHWVQTICRFYQFLDFGPLPAMNVNPLMYSLRHVDISNASTLELPWPPILHDSEPIVGGYQYGRPECQIPGRMIGSDDQHEFALRTILYRGFVNGRPFSGPNRYSSHLDDGSQVYDHSLLLNDDYGVYGRMYKKTLAAFDRRKDVSATFNLSLPDLLNFSFKKKIRVQNSNYLIARMQPTFTMNGLAPTNVELIRCV